MNPYEEGYEDGLDGHWANPYKPETADYEDYSDGYDEGEFERWSLEREDD